MKSAEITIVDLCEVIDALDEARYIEPDLEKVEAAKVLLHKLVSEIMSADE